jgi:hypothetical protein
MQQSNALGICLRTAASLALCLGLAQIGKADTITDTSLDVDYTATSTFKPVTDNMFDVFLIIDPTVFDAVVVFSPHFRWPLTPFHSLPHPAASRHGAPKCQEDSILVIAMVRA